MKYALDVCLAAVMAPFFGLFIYGIATYPDPIHPCGNGQFCGKSHRLYTEEQFQAFLRWEAQLLISLPPGLAAGFLLSRRSRRRKYEAWGRLSLLQGELSPEIEGQKYAAAWTSLRRRELAGMAFLVSAVVCFVGAFMLRPDPESTILPLLQLSLPLFLVSVGLSIWTSFVRCPRCGNRHFMNKAFRKTKQRCVCCGLRRGAIFAEALGELKEPR